MICDNLSVRNGHLCFAGIDTTELAARYGTPLYLMDEDKIREKCRLYKQAFAASFPEGSLPYYASKANSFKRLLEIVKEEGMGADVVSPGEIYTALQAGFDPEKLCFHGNNKTDADIAYAMDRRIGCFAVDNEEELSAVEAAAAERNIIQKIQLRITPGIDTHTYEEVNTGKVDSKFGNAIETGQAEAITVLALSLPHIFLEGFHCHVGSQVFEEDVFERSAVIMLRFMADMRKQHGCEAKVLNLGGGYGVPYVSQDKGINIAEKTASVGAAIRSCCEELGMAVPEIHMEPGRSIVADAGMTLYHAGSLKRIPGYKNYVAIDGGIPDNPRYALYRSAYTVYDASRMDEEASLPCDVVGRCCESGDIIQPNVCLPESVCRDDVIAVCTTGAYNYSMASHYNKIPKPAVVMLAGGKDYLAVRRESIEDICRNEL